jgi:hypothetical protein
MPERGSPSRRDPASAFAVTPFGNEGTDRSLQLVYRSFRTVSSPLLMMLLPDSTTGTVRRLCNHRHRVGDPEANCIFVARSNRPARECTVESAPLVDIVPPIAAGFLRASCQPTRSSVRRPASTPEVPFCAADRIATTVVPARCSAPGRVCSIAGSSVIGVSHGIGRRAWFCVLCGCGRRPPCLLLLHATSGAERITLPTELRLPLQSHL